MKHVKKLGDVATQLVLAIGIILAIFPLFWIVLASFKNTRDATSGARNAFQFAGTWENYAILFQNPSFAQAAGMSLLITVASTLVVVAVATLGGYAFARLPIPGRGVLAVVMVTIQIIPGIVLVVPLYRLVSEGGMYDSWVPICIVMIGLTTPFATWLMLAFFRGSPVEIEEAAFVDGVTRFQLFRYVLIPMVAPGMAAAAIFTAISVWNSFLIPVVLSQSNAQTLTVFVSKFVTFQEIHWGPLCAASVVILAPIVAFVLSMQGMLVKGLTAGGLK